MSHPTRGGWIEISKNLTTRNRRKTSHPTRGGWIEIPDYPLIGVVDLSHPTRGGWIEILMG